jgi:predicted HNH restriction endonuclease
MKKDDIIYAKKGPYIIGKGVITKEYRYDPNILRGTIANWEHFVTVNWDKKFPGFNLDLGANQITVLKLEGWRLNKIHEAESQIVKKAKIVEANEGERYTIEATFRERNRVLIEAKKANSDYHCEVCNMSFKEIYGKIGEKYIIAHHIEPIGSRNNGSKTTLDDISLVCANCHDMLHRYDPPMSIGELKKIIEHVS